PGAEVAPGQPGARDRSRSRSVHRVAGCNGRWVAGAAAHPRSHRWLDVTAGPPGRPPAAAAGRGPHLRRRAAAARPASRRRRRAPAGREHAQGARPGRPAAGPGRPARPRPDGRRAAARQLTPETAMQAFDNTVTIARPPRQVSAFLAEFENVPRWDYATTQTR